MYEVEIHDYLKKKGLPEYGIAGLMGNLFAESGLNPAIYKIAMKILWA